ncbi:hypothetical protein HII31_07648 [Pseudocercospora fuligena]|uniref:F-box domain-containing protein n=1 Tax=Pseudocercospora fuligena TaxID=685502 RepID=A0A8H6VK63_9PEZI|nr:hypothetical protein HII31_07648 [Pseudocercospora fuligena]
MFRFLDLPPELRDRVYSFVTSDLGSQSLAFFKPPPITRVSKAVRSESLAVLFAEGITHVIVGSDLFHRERVLRGLPSTYVSSGLGSLDLHPIVERCICSAKSSALFRNVTFDVHHPGVFRHGPGRALWDNSLQLATLKLHVKNGFLTVQERSANACYKFAEPSTEADVQAALDVVVQVAEEIASRDQFSGFTLEDLKAVASRIHFL